MKTDLLGPARGRGETRAIVLKLARRGKTTREISAEAGISTQATNYHLKKLRESGHLPDEEIAS